MGTGLGSYLESVTSAQQRERSRVAQLEAELEQVGRQLELCRRQIITYADTDEQYRTEMAVKVAKEGGAEGYYDVGVVYACVWLQKAVRMGF